MKQSGIARKLDKLGRIVVPIEARRVLGWEDTTPIEIVSLDITFFCISMKIVVLHPLN